MSIPSKGQIRKLQSTESAYPHRKALFCVQLKMLWRKDENNTQVRFISDIH